MNFQLFSDTHIEIYNRCLNLPVEADYLILAGDIGQIDNIHYHSFLRYVSQNWKKVFYVLGNHEYYHLNIDEALDKYRKLFDGYENIILLENEYHDIDDIRIYGFTGWTNPKTYTTEFLNDYEQIEGITEEKVSKLSCRSIAKFNEFLLNNDKKLIVVTHFPPLRNDTSHEKYNKSSLNNYFTWKFDDVIEDKSLTKNIGIWCSGHTHHCYDFGRYGIRFISNQIGYREDEQCPNNGLFSTLSNGFE